MSPAPPLFLSCSCRPASAPSKKPLFIPAPTAISANGSWTSAAKSKPARAWSKSTADRWRSLLKDKAVSEQEEDEKAGALAAREADVNAAKAAVRRLEQLTSYKQIRAPFSGIVTRRNVDTGALILAGSGGAANALFNLAQISTLRVFVDVP